jgi:hypothetical protein
VHRFKKQIPVYEGRSMEILEAINTYKISQPQMQKRELSECGQKRVLESHFDFILKL